MIKCQMCYIKKERMKNIRSILKKISVMCFVMLVLAVVYSAPALAETTTQATLTGTQSDLKLNSQVTINKAKQIAESKKVKIKNLELESKKA